MKKYLISQGEAFKFTEENLKTAENLIKHYPKGRQASALLPLFDLAQRQNKGWLSQEAVEYVCQFLQITFMQGYEVATFYSMFNLKPVGKYFVQVCTTTPCQLKGALDVLKACQDFTQVPQNEISSDGLFSVTEVECLGACVNAPIVQINDDFYEDVNPEHIQKILTSLQDHRPLLSGSQIGRQGSAPANLQDQSSFEKKGDL